MNSKWGSPTYKLDSNLKWGLANTVIITISLSHQSTTYQFILNMHYKPMRLKSFTLTTPTNSCLFRSLSNYLNIKLIGSWWFHDCNNTVKQVTWRLRWNGLSNKEALGSELLKNISYRDNATKGRDWRILHSNTTVLLGSK